MAEFGSGREADNVRIATPLEHLIAQGFHMADEVCLDCDIGPLAMIPDQLHLKGMDIKALSGNGMNMITQTAFMLFCLSYTERVGEADEVVVIDDEWA